MSSAMVNIPSDHMMALASALHMVRDTQTMEMHVSVTSAQRSEGSQCLSNAGTVGLMQHHVADACANLRPQTCNGAGHHHDLDIYLWCL